MSILLKRIATSGCRRYDLARIKELPTRFTNTNVASTNAAAVGNYLSSNINSSYKRRFASSSHGIATDPFQRLVRHLKSANQTCTIIESSCGGLISSSLMGVPGSSAVYYGGTVAYNTKKSEKLLCGDEKLHKRLLSPVENKSDDVLLNEHPDLSDEARTYVKSKLHQTREAALKYCQHVETDYAIAEGGATGPTFRPKGLTAGFAVLTIAGRKGGGVEILAQKIVRSTHTDREGNMRLFADSAAELCIETLGITDKSSLGETRMTVEENIGSDGINKQDMYLDRSSILRSNATEMNRLYEDPDALHVILRGSGEVMFATATELALSTLSNIIEEGIIGEYELKNRTFLGRIGQTPVVAVFLSKDTTYKSQNGYFAITRSHAPMLTPLHNELALTATAYNHWQQSHQYCYVCGSPLEYIHGGTVSVLSYYFFVSFSESYTNISIY